MLRTAIAYRGSQSVERRECGPNAKAEIVDTLSKLVGKCAQLVEIRFELFHNGQFVFEPRNLGEKLLSFTLRLGECILVIEYHPAGCTA